MQIKILVPVLILVVDLLLCNLILISSVLIILHPFIIYHILPSYSVILTERWTDIDPSSTVVGCVVAAGRRQRFVYPGPCVAAARLLRSYIMNFTYLYS